MSTLNSSNIFGEIYFYGNKNIGFLYSDEFFLSIIINTHSNSFNTINNDVEIFVMLKQNEISEYNKINKKIENLFYHNFNFIIFSDNKSNEDILFPMMATNVMLKTYSKVNHIEGNEDFHITFNVNKDNLKMGEKNVSPIFV